MTGDEARTALDAAVERAAAPRPLSEASARSAAAA